MQVVGDVLPIGILSLYEAQLPLTRPFFDRLLTGNCRRQQIVLFKPDQCFDVVPGREAWGQFVLMFKSLLGKSFVTPV